MTKDYDNTHVSDGQTHVFAFYYPLTTKLIAQKKFEFYNSLDDQIIVHRIGHVLRLAQGEQCILFDDQHHLLCQIEAIQQKNIVYSVKSVACNIRLQPEITFILPLLKREALQESLYSVVELGATHVQLVMTKKTHHNWGGHKELERFNRIMQSAAEQSKNFAMPTLSEPVLLNNYFDIQERKSHKIFFDSDGCVVSSVLSSIKAENIANIVMMIGPEGDLTHDEKQLLHRQGFIFCKLTPTILRAQQAVVVGLGIFRSMLCSQNIQSNS